MDYKFASAEDSVQRQFMVTSAHSSRRPEYWSLPKWEAEVSQGVSEPLDLSQWPDADLCQRLIDIYFETDNLTMPLLNKIIFRRDYDAGRWKSDRLFAKVCLMVFANAARFVDDPRAWWYADDEAKAREAMLSNPEVYRHSAGWKWCEMVINMGKSFLVVAVLEDLQIYVVSARPLFDPFPSFPDRLASRPISQTANISFLHLPAPLAIPHAFSRHVYRMGHLWFRHQGLPGHRAPFQGVGKSIRNTSGSRALQASVLVLCLYR